MEALIRNDIDLNFAIQREAALQNELEALSVKKKLLAAPEPVDATTSEEIRSRIRTTEAELRTLNETIWRLERGTHAVLRQFPEGPLLRAVNANRARSRWHMAPLLKEDCVGGDGCCARKCGCCTKPRSETRSKKGHCTPACACCERARGFAVEREESWEPTRIAFADGLDECRDHMQRLMLAYCFGLRGIRYYNNVGCQH
ncbi:hypothetical protein BO82DRAFT_283322 [Aspergillus uvarum CBS 121591]|uniref:Uncharacterized protein n=1 Tax=Aspergillus uvarum CBS 121591 TaxID=1448315 RepID=A0A319CCH1_9EURO|nr:hypothetical protein BO82DRAFT_283322 [Aspergillus uvarum CBS 121591]PYH81899.1 hypothetical protein BO82DRAFT_283322 [Aspergillus uvarum CBS 121591]